MARYDKVGSYNVDVYRKKPTNWGGVVVVILGLLFAMAQCAPA